MSAGGGAEMVYVTVTFADVAFVPETVTTAVYAPAARFVVFGTMSSTAGVTMPDPLVCRRICLALKRAPTRWPSSCETLSLMFAISQPVGCPAVYAMDAVSPVSTTVSDEVTLRAPLPGRPPPAGAVNETPPAGALITTVPAPVETAVTVIVAESDLPPAFATTVVVPALTPVTRPVVSTVATPGFRLLHEVETFVRMTLVGENTVSISCVVEPTATVADVGATSTFPTGTSDVLA